MAYDTGDAAGPRVTLVAAMPRSPFEDLVHRVNNLLGTIEIQAEVARDGGLPEHRDALRLIVESARRTQAELRELQAARRARGEAAD